MAELFLARGEADRLVVLKRILPTNAENPRFVRLFLDEAKLAAGLDHPHIAKVYDTGNIDGAYYFTMEYIHGQDVRTVLRRTDRQDKKFPIRHAVHIARDVASALHYAHERRGPSGALLGLVHRDVSPSNVLVGYDGSTKLVDFGVAKAATSSTKTRTGALKGKISYMSPEQARGGAVDRRSDLFALGIVLWEMVTTTRLFKAENDLATIQMIIHTTPPPPSSLNPECPPALEKIILRALAPTAEARYQTAAEMQRDLDALVGDTGMVQSTPELSAHMHEMFAAEIQAWKAAQAAGITLIDHVVSASKFDMTTPISDSDLELEEDDEPSVDHDVPTQHRAPIEVTKNERVRRPPPPTPSMMFPQSETTEASPSIFVEVHDEKTEIVTEPPIHTPTALASGQFQAARGSTPSGGIPPISDRVTPFPIAPREWLPQVDIEPPVDWFPRFRNRVLVITAITVALIDALSIAFGS